MIKKRITSSAAHIAASLVGTIAMAACSGAEFAAAEGGATEGTSELGAELAGGHALGLLRDPSATVSARRLVSAPPVGALPASLDLSSKIPTPGDQGAEGSCVGWATGYAMKSYHEGLQLKGKLTDDRYQFSASWIYNQINFGVDGGSYPADALQLIVDAGADSLQFFPYTAGSFTTQPDDESFDRAARFKATNWGTLAVNSTTFKQTLNGGQPIMIAIEVLPDFDSLNAANPIYNDSTGNSRGGHAVTIIGYDDTKSAFRFINSWGTGWGLSGYGWIDYNFITNAKLSLDAYTLTDGANSAPPSSNSMYVVQGGRLWRADNDFGDSTKLTDTDWTGATSATTVTGVVYIIQNNRLHKVDPATGAQVVLGNADWAGATHMAAVGNSLYIQKGVGLWQVDNLDNGAYHRVGNIDWSAATGMTSYEGDLYVIQGAKLYKVNPATGARAQLGNLDWSGNVRMAATANGTNIVAGMYVVQGANLWQVDNFATGARHKLGTTDWTGATSMSRLDGKLYIVKGNTLSEVSTSNGAPEALGPAAWTGATVMTAVR